MNRALAFFPLLALAETMLPGCVAAAIPAPAARQPAPMILLPSFGSQDEASFLSASPSGPNQRGFAQFVRYGRQVATAMTNGTAPLSAILSDPVALDGKRRPCSPGGRPVVVIDLDPMGDTFAPPTTTPTQTGIALGLAVLREAGVAVVWLSDLSVDETGAVRTALEQAGLDPRGKDIISLRRDAADRKHARLESLAATACIIAMAGDERPDFDERFKYLRTPQAGTGLEPLIGDGWFLIEPVFPKEGQKIQ